MTPDFTKYIDLSQLNKEQQALFVGSMTDLVLARMANMIGDYLTEEQISQLEKLGAQGDGEQVMAWLNEHIPNFAQGIDEILAEESAGLARKITALTSLVTAGN